MNLILIRTRASDLGVFGRLRSSPEGLEIASTLEHSYNGVPKLPPGTYTCVRGLHRLAHMESAFMTFEITGVRGHTNMLFHTGNTNKDSDGCVLLGSAATDTGIIGSRVAFQKFMDLQDGVDEFKLDVLALPT